MKCDDDDDAIRKKLRFFDQRQAQSKHCTISCRKIQKQNEFHSPFETRDIFQIVRDKFQSFWKTIKMFSFSANRVRRTYARVCVCLVNASGNFSVRAPCTVINQRSMMALLHWTLRFNQRQVFISSIAFRSEIINKKKKTLKLPATENVTATEKQWKTANIAIWREHGIFLSFPHSRSREQTTEKKTQKSIWKSFRILRSELNVWQSHGFSSCRTKWIFFA